MIANARGDNGDSFPAITRTRKSVPALLLSSFRASALSLFRLADRSPLSSRKCSAHVSTVSRRFERRSRGGREGARGTSAVNRPSLPLCRPPSLRMRVPRVAATLASYRRMFTLDFSPRFRAPRMTVRFIGQRYLVRLAG